MTKVLVLYYSTYGHVEQLANAIAEGARAVEDVHVDIKRTPDPPGAAPREQPAPVAEIDDLTAYDAIVIGVGTRFAHMASPMSSFLDQAGGLWARGALTGKVGSAFSSTATQHGGQELTLMAIHANLLHFGMVLVGLPYAWAGQMTLDEITGGAPYGITTIAGSQGQRQPSANELDGARFQGRLVAETAKKLHGAPAAPETTDAPS
jgi:NAD(P)H dehydrogenase (quinone)